MLKLLQKTKLTFRFFSRAQVVHTPDNLNTTSQVFNFTKENEEKIENLLKKYPGNYQKSGVIPLLFLA
jgi:hypothetical protein